MLGNKNILTSLMLLLVLLSSCTDENGIYETDQMLLSSDKSSIVLPTPSEGVAAGDFTVTVSALSNSDREILVEIDPSSTASSDQYQLSNLVIPAGQYTGTVSVSGVFSALPETGSVTLTVNIIGIQGGEAVVSNGSVSIELFRKCPFPAGDYVLELADSFGDGWDGALIRVTIDGISSDYTIASGSGANHVVSVPENTEELMFAYVPGNYEEEHSYTITAPSGIVINSDGPNPAPGEILFNPCNI